MTLESAKELIGKKMIHPVFGIIEVKDISQMKDGTILAYHDGSVCNIIILRRIDEKKQNS